MKVGPKQIVSWIPVINLVYDLGVKIAERVRARRAKRRAKAAKASKL